ncbi:MAG: hypothetical protein KDK39_08540, partial [Leptospiraceae bacterium]|nr:hypothetical protein [Leptospiraceae bacterium]
MDYIPINSIQDLDPKKISVRDINKRYIDRDGNRYATRFNMKTRSIEVVRLARNQQEAQLVRDAIMRGKREKLGNQLPGQVMGKGPRPESRARPDLNAPSKAGPNRATQSPGTVSRAAPAANSGELVGDDLDMSDLNLDDDVDFAAYTEVQKNPMAAAVPATGST